jgi:hypothetical protein
MTTTVTAPPAPVRPIVPRPLWERHDLFREPDFPAGVGLSDEDGDLEDEA